MHPTRRGSRRHVPLLTILIMMGACSDRGANPADTSTTLGPVVLPITSVETRPTDVVTDASAGSSVPSPTVRPPASTYPADWFDTELTASTAEAHHGETVDVSIKCPDRGTSFAAEFEVAHDDLTFAMEEVRTTTSDIYSTSFVVPYWLKPGPLELRGGCPRPPDPCDDTADCHEYETDPTPLVTLMLTSDGKGAWDSWRPVAEPYVDPTAEFGATPLGGTVMAGTELPSVQVEAPVGDQIRVATQCPADAATGGARFIVMPSRTIALSELTDDWGWSITPDPDHPGRYDISSGTLLVYERSLGEPLPWFVEVAPLSTTPSGTTVAVVGDINLDPEIVPADDPGAKSLYVTALCEDVGMPFDPRSIDTSSASQPLAIWLPD